ncbi:MAG: polysaccharide biosynthesis/export family protein [Terracidiphilus sp.]|jgi:polysaccharide export outer membrane protein
MAKFVVCLALAICWACCCPAQTESLLIGPGDLLSVQVLEAPELAQHARVTDAGTLPLILGGEVKVAGLTPAEAATAVKDVLVAGHYLLNPHVSVTDDQYATQNVTVLGQVAHPGVFPIVTPRSVLDVLGLSGGVTELADRRVMIERHATKEHIQYFLSNKSSIALDNQVRVYPGDTVIVPKIDVVYVLGDVARPGGFPMATNDGKMTLLRAIALAGSQHESSVPNATRVIRRQSDGSYVEMKVALSKMEKGQQADMELQPDDIVFLPFSYLRNMATNMTALAAAAATATIYRF